MSKSKQIRTRVFKDTESSSHRVRKTETINVLPLALKKTTKTFQILKPVMVLAIELNPKRQINKERSSLKLN